MPFNKYKLPIDYRGRTGLKIWLGSGNGGNVEDGHRWEGKDMGQYDWEGLVKDNFQIPVLHTYTHTHTNTHTHTHTHAHIHTHTHTL